jgi:ankyrin repeat protein
MNRSLLHQACQGNSTTLIRHLILQYDADVDAKDDTNSTPLHIAASSGNENAVATLIKEFGCDTKVRGNCGRSLLHYACIGGNVNIVRMLVLQCKADVDACDDYNNTPLHEAASSGKEDVVLALIKDFKCDTHVRGLLGRSFLHSASVKGLASVVKAAGSYMPPSLMADDHGDTPLHLAAGSGDGECVEALLQLGHSVLALNQVGKTPMGVARGRAKAVLTVFMTSNEEPGVPTPPNVARDENMSILEGPDGEGEYVVLVGSQHSIAPPPCMLVNFLEFCIRCEGHTHKPHP